LIENEVDLMKRILAYVLPAFALINLASADIAGHAKTSCETDESHNTKCTLQYDLSDNPRRFYLLHVLDNELLAWVPAKESENPEGEFNVEPEALYRVQACDNQAFSLNCVTSSAAWAPSLRPIGEIPTSMEISDIDGSSMTASFVETDSRYLLLSQYNVYVVVDLVARVSAIDIGILPEMLPPVESYESDHRTLDHQIIHSVQSNYEGIRTSPAAIAR